MYKLKPVIEHPVLEGVFKRLYAVKIPEMYLRSLEDVKSRGTYTTGDPEQDKVLQNSLARTYRTINDMYELWKDGVEIYVVNYSDTEKIYNAIQKHLHYWLDFINHGIGVKATPIDDLLGLDEFANVVYDKAKYTFTEESFRPAKAILLQHGLTMNPMDFNFRVQKSVKFNHYFLSESEKLQQEGINEIHLRERESLEKDFISVAAKYGIGISEETKKPSNEIPFDLKFGNQP